MIGILSCFHTGLAFTPAVVVQNDSIDDPLTKKSDWEYGMLAGLLFSTIEGDLTEQHSYVPDFNVGGFAQTEIFSPLGFRVELYYAGLGTGFVSLGDSKLHLNYLVFPAMFTYQFRPAVGLGLGPYFGYLLNAKDRGDDYEDEITDLLNRLDVGVKIGVYFEVSRVLGLAVWFQRGFINTQSGERVSTLKQYNQSVMFTTSLNISRLLNR